MLRQFIQWLNETSNTQQLDRSYLFFRKCVGVIGIALPFVLVIGTIILEWHLGISDSISAYYYSVTRNILVGILCSTAIFLICYRYERLDDFFSTIAGASAIGVALFPTAPDGPVTGQQMIIGLAHGLFALFFFGTLAFFALRIFRKSDQKNPMDRTLEKRQRDIVYLVCGIAICACIVLLLLIALIQLLSGKPWLQTLHPVLFLESLAIFAFGIAWFVKGGTLGILKDKKGGA
jgi:hypothetical protein